MHFHLNSEFSISNYLLGLSAAHQVFLPWHAYVLHQKSFFYQNCVFLFHFSFIFHFFFYSNVSHSCMYIFFFHLFSIKNLFRWICSRRKFSSLHSPPEELRRRRALFHFHNLLSFKQASPQDVIFWIHQKWWTI